MSKASDVHTTREIVYYRDEGICQVCGQSVPWPGELAHIVSQSEENIKKYGEAVIQHPRNMLLVCQQTDCNDAAMIGEAPEVELAHIAEIQRAIARGHYD